MFQRPIGPISTALLLLIASLTLIMSGCLDGGDKTDELDVVAVSIMPEKEMVQAIAGEDVKIIVMVPSGQDPHNYSPTPGQMADLVDADIYFKIGSGVEFEEINMEIFEETNDKMKIVDLSQGIDILSFDEHHDSDEHDHEEEENHEEDEHDHDHEGTDPHIWLSPNNMKKMAETVLNALIEEDGDNEDLYTTNYKTYISGLDDAIAYMEGVLQNHKDEEFMVYHPAWGYFGDDFDLIQISVEDEGKEPGPQGIANLIEQAKEHNITVVFVEPQFDSSTAEQIADEIGGNVVMVDPLASDYIDNLKEVAGKFAEE